MNSSNVVYNMFSYNTPNFIAMIGRFGFGKTDYWEESELVAKRKCVTLSIFDDIDLKDKDLLKKIVHDNYRRKTNLTKPVIGYLI